jgi:hypothetical protein
VTEIERTKKNVLVVDDIRTMKFEATTVRTVAEGLTSLYSQPWDEVWLDHDLDFSLTYHQILSNTGQRTIRPLVRRIVNDAMAGHILPVKMFVIHTSFGKGRDWIADMLLPWYTVGVTIGDRWVAFEEYPKWAEVLLDEDGNWNAEELQAARQQVEQA